MEKDIKQVKLSVRRALLTWRSRAEARILTGTIARTIVTVTDVGVLKIRKTNGSEGCSKGTPRDAC